MKIFLIILTLAVSHLLHAQQRDTVFTEIRTISGDITDAVFDHLDNLYLVTSNGQVKKFNAAGDSAALYNQVRNFGKLHTLDVSNPLRPLLFYKDFGTIVVLDRFLSNRATIDLRRFNMLQPVAVGQSYDNNIWVFDSYDNKLRKIDEQGNMLLETPDFRNVFSRSIVPQRIINTNGIVYLADSLSGIYLFDNYGTFQKRVELTGWESISIRGGDIIRTVAEGVIVYNPATFTEQRFTYPAAFRPYYHSLTGSDKIVGLTPQSVVIYRYRL